MQTSTDEEHDAHPEEPLTAAKRRVMNRQNAKRSRQRKKNYTAELDQRAKDLMSQNDKLRSDLRRACFDLVQANVSSHPEYAGLVRSALSVLDSSPVNVEGEVEAQLQQSEHFHQVKEAKRAVSRASGGADSASKDGAGGSDTLALNAAKALLLIDQAPGGSESPTEPTGQACDDYPADGISEVAQIQATDGSESSDSDESACTATVTKIPGALHAPTVAAGADRAVQRADAVRALYSHSNVHALTRALSGHVRGLQPQNGAGTNSIQVQPPPTPPMQHPEAQHFPAGPRPALHPHGGHFESYHGRKPSQPTANQPTASASAAAESIDGVSAAEPQPLAASPSVDPSPRPEEKES